MSVDFLLLIDGLSEQDKIDLLNTFKLFTGDISRVSAICCCRWNGFFTQFGEQRSYHPTARSLIRQGKAVHWNDIKDKVKKKKDTPSLDFFNRTAAAFDRHAVNFTATPFFVQQGTIESFEEEQDVWI